MKRYKGSITKLLSTVCPEYKKSCMDFVSEVITDLKLNNVQDVQNVPLEYRM